MLSSDSLSRPWYTRRAVWVTVLVVAFLGFSCWFDQYTGGQRSEIGGQTPVSVRDDGEIASRDGLAPDDFNGVPGGDDAVGAPSRTVTSQNSFALTRTTAGTCTADRPGGWSNLISVEGNQGADLASNDKTMYAAYAVKPINTQLAAFASVQPPPTNDPDLYSEDPALVTLAHAKIFVSGLGGDTALALTDEINESIGDYQIQSVASSTHKGVIYYHRSGFPGDGVNYAYALPMRFALTRSDRWDSFGLMVARVAASIQCTATLVARAQSGPDLGGSESSSSAKDENGSDAGYNPQLGTEEVHDPETGQNYVVSPSTNWSDTGPQGPGYYAPKGGTDYVHLQPGRID